MSTVPRSANNGPNTILVVEDEVLVRMAIAEYLRDCDFKVIEAVNADEAFFVLQQDDLEIDVVLSDVEMPGSMDGFALARWVRENRKNVDIVLAGTPSRAAQAASDLCERGPLLAKPYEPGAVVDRIRRLIAKRDKQRGMGET